MNYVCALLMLVRVSNAITEPSSTFKTPYSINGLISESDEVITMASDIINFMDEHVEKFRYAQTRNLILLLGDAESEKMTIALLLSGFDLEAIEISSSKFSYVDRLGLIKKYSENIIPELITDKKSGLDYCVLPGFSRSTDIKTELLILHLTQKILDFSENVKLVFVVDHSAFINALDSFERRQYLRDFATNLTIWIKDIEKLRVSFSLIVTNVETYTEMNDKNEIIYTATVLLQVQRDFETANQNPSISNEEIEENKKKIEFIKIIVEKERREYPRISVFRKANQTASVYDLPWLQSERKHILRNTLYNTQYVNKSNDDFSFPISSQSRNQIPELIEELENRLAAEVSKISIELEQFYRQQEKQHTDYKVLYEIMDMSYQKISEINFEEPKEFGRLLIQAIQELKVDLLTDNLKSLLNHIELLEYLETMSYIQIFEIADELMNTKRFLNESRKWYDFVIKLHDVLSEFEIQGNITEYQRDVAKLMVQFSIEKYEEKNIDSTDLREFLDRTGYNYIYNSIEQMTVNSYKLNAAMKILNLTMNDNIVSSCSFQKLTMKGYNVKISDIFNVECSEQAQFIEIFALNKIFIDADIDKTGEGAQIVIIASIWEIIGNRQISMNGSNIEIYVERALQDSQVLESGCDGRPGFFGGSGGHFVGVGYEFRNVDDLTIFADGGRGGAGENGGPGLNGIEGEDPPVANKSTNAESVWKRDGFMFKLLEQKEVKPQPNYIQAIATKYRVWAKSSKPPTDGYCGGTGGIGGYPGNVYVISLEKSVNFSIFNEQGQNGTDGLGGQNGKSVVKEKFKEVTYVDQKNIYNQTVYGLPEVKNFTNGTFSAKKGGDGCNSKGIVKPTFVEFVNPSYTMNNYKHHVREDHAMQIWEKDRRNYLEKFEEETQIQSFYNASSLIDDYQCLESQYYYLRNRLSFIPFIESLLKRTNLYVENCTISHEDKAALKLLYTTSLSKRCALKNHEDRVSVLSLLEQLESIQENIDKMHDAIKEVNVEEQKNHYKNLLDNKVFVAKKFIKTQINPEIESIFINEEKRIFNILHDIINQENETEGDLDEIANKRSKLESAVRLHHILSTMKTVSSILLYFLSIGATAVELIGDETLIAQSWYQCPQNVSMNRTRQENMKLFNLIAALSLHVFRIRKVFEKEHKLFMKQLIDIETELNGTSTEWALPIKTKVKELKERVIEEIKGDLISDAGEVYQMRLELGNLLYESIESSPEGSGGINRWSENEDKEICNYLIDILKITNISLRVYESIRGDKVKIKEMSSAILNIQHRLDAWKEGETSIYKIVVVHIRNIQDDIITMRQKMADESYIELDSSKYCHQSVFKNVKMIINEISEWTTFEDILSSSIERLDEATAILINICDRIDAYAEKAKFAAYFTHLNLNETTAAAGPLLNKVSELKTTIRTNLIFEQYEILMTTITQHRFPFGSIHIPIFELPVDLQFNDTKIIAKKTKDYISYLKEHINLSDLSLGEDDRGVFGNIDFGTSAFGSFFTWKNVEIRREIEKLLSGKEITVKTDISKGLNVNSIKFKEIGIHLVMENESAQIDIDSILDKFRVRMTMVGNNYYRCGTRIYYISIDDNIVFDYSLRKDVDGTPIKVNEIYRKVKERDYFLSPYVTWSIKLIRDNSTMPNKDFEELQLFKDDLIDLKLYGRGKYLKNEGPLSPGICNDKLNHFYHFDDTSILNILKMLKFQYSL